MDGTAPRLRILGTLEVRVGDRVLDLGGPRRLRLLAMLAARAGQPVGYAHLAEAIWDTDAPPTARRQAQNAVSQVRSLLHRAHSGIVISTLPAGYRLDVDPWLRGAAESGHRLSPHPDHPRRLREALTLARRNGLRICAAECLATQAVVAADLGDAATARTAARGALEIRDDTGMAFADRALGTRLERLATG